MNDNNIDDLIHRLANAALTEKSNTVDIAIVHLTELLANASITPQVSEGTTTGDSLAQPPANSSNVPQPSEETLAAIFLTAQGYDLLASDAPPPILWCYRMVEMIGLRSKEPNYKPPLPPISHTIFPYWAISYGGTTHKALIDAAHPDAKVMTKRVLYVRDYPRLWKAMTQFSSENLGKILRDQDAFDLWLREQTRLKLNERKSQGKISKELETRLFRLPKAYNPEFRLQIHEKETERWARVIAKLRDPRDVLALLKRRSRSSESSEQRLAKPVTWVPDASETFAAQYGHPHSAGSSEPRLATSISWAPDDSEAIAALYVRTDCTGSSEQRRARPVNERRERKIRHRAARASHQSPRGTADEAGTGVTYDQLMGTWC
ncbi:hypothetical protein BDV96DRAFT_17948 [Lophiotrema nucula]|uniref:Uncharacterized protein n=1 Tax=Lophiotrema nucula TaxID=690887 RepID=A0A6A5ZF59_9PLEO|nr:hypothetical protein BDV96DRAFT_17948 [Lophiotrema nucula]